MRITGTLLGGSPSSMGNAKPLSRIIAAWKSLKMRLRFQNRPTGWRRIGYGFLKRRRSPCPRRPWQALMPNPEIDLPRIETLGLAHGLGRLVELEGHALQLRIGLWHNPDNFRG